MSTDEKKKLLALHRLQQEEKDETAIPEGDQQRKEKKRLLDLQPIHVQGWPKHSTFRREEIYNDDGR